MEASDPRRRLIIRELLVLLWRFLSALFFVFDKKGGC